MPNTVSPQNELSYLGVTSPNPPTVIKATRAPTTQDANFPVGTIWVDTAGAANYMLVKVAGSTATWDENGAGVGVVATLTADTGGALNPTAGNINILGTANQISTTGAGSTITVSIPAVAGNTTSFTSGSFITSSATLGTTFTQNSLTPTGSNANIDLLVNGKGTGGVIQSRGLVGGDITIEATNTDNTNAASRAGFEVAVGGGSAGDPYVNFLVSGAGQYTMGIDNSVSDNFVLAASAALGTSNIASWTSAGALTNAADITATTGNIVASAGNISTTVGSITSATTLTATLGDISATNGNLVLGTAGNKIVSTSVASTTTAGANSFGTVTLVGGAATINTSAVTASSIIMLTRQSVGLTGAAALGQLSIGTIVANTSFEINAWSAADATALQASDVSSIGWMIIN